MAFPDGNGPPRTKDALTKAIAELRKCGNFQPRVPIPDATGHVCAHLVMDPRGNLFYLVARTAELWKDKFFGTQLKLINQASKFDRPIVLAAEGKFFVFDPYILRRDMDGTNQRFGVDMANCSIEMGREWDPVSTAVYVVFRRLQAEGTTR